MKIIKEIFGDNCVCNSINKKGKCTIVEVDNKKYAIKNKTTDINKTYEYLESIKFDHYPKIILENDKYDVYEYIETVSEPIEQKAYDMIDLMSLLHSKTTYYKEMDIDEYKELFERIMQKIVDTTTYYNNLIDSIERHMFMSPSEYLIARNISKILEVLESSRQKIIKWYDVVKMNNRKRIVTLYNNMDLDHILRNSNLYLTSWEKSVQGSPVLDLYNFYKKNYLISDFSQLFKKYQNKYPLEESEKLLFYILISIPDELKLTFNEYENCKRAKTIIDYLYKSEVLINKLEDIKK